MCERGLQPRHADGKAGRRHRLAAEARHQAIITPAAADRAEAHGAAFFVFGLKQQFHLVDRAGVVFEATDDGKICPNLAVIISRGPIRKRMSSSSLNAVNKIAAGVQLPILILIVADIAFGTCHKMLPFISAS